MTKYNFDEVTSRQNTGCLKYDFAVQRGRPADVLPFWVADMDFPIAREIQEALLERCQHAIFGYSESDDAYFAAVHDWYAKHFGWETQQEWLTKTPGVVFALAAAVRAFTKPGDGVLINSPLVLKGGKYSIDFADLEKKIVEHKVKLYILCSPHNPVGRVWSREELLKLGDICLAHNVLIISDEIHSDFVWGDNKHTVFASLGADYAQNCVVCTAPSKTFNIAGLQVSNIFIPNAKLRRAFQHEVAAAGYSQLNTLGLVACEAAYRYGEDWLAQVKAYIEANINFLNTYLAENLPQLKLLAPQGTYLVWLDCSALGLTVEEREQWLLHKAHLWLDGGGIFGPEGQSFKRINVACPRSTLLQGLEQLKRAVDNL